MKKQLIVILTLVTVLICGCIGVSIRSNNNTISTNASATQQTEATTETSAQTEKPTETQGAIDESKPLIAITFDDGPSSNTERVLDIFKKHNAKATFFVLGNRIAGKEDVLKRMANEGHDIGSHSWDHSELTTLNKNDLNKQIKDTQLAIFEASGYNSKLLRPPYGAWDEKVKNITKENDISIINWNIDTLDWNTKTGKKISKLIMKEARDGCIILCHDLYDQTVNAMEIAIPKLIKQGYQLVTVTDLIESHDGELQPGMVYYNRWQEPK